MKAEEVVHILEKEGYLATAQRNLLNAYYSGRIISLHYEIKIIFWLGITLLLAGIGIWVKDQITQTTVILALSCSSLGCFVFTQIKRKPFSTGEVKSPSIIYDGILVLGCLLLTTLQSYLEYKYSIFQGHWDIFTLIPTILFFFIAYYYDHRGVLLLALTGLTSWVGFQVTPDATFFSDLVKHPELINISIIYSVILLGIAAVIAWKNLKKHFSVIYINFYINLLFSSILTGFFYFNQSLIYLIILGIASSLILLYARQTKSVVLLLYSIVYCYIGVSGKILTLINRFSGLYSGKHSGMETELASLYFLISSVIIAYFLFKKRRSFEKEVK